MNRRTTLLLGGSAALVAAGSTLGCTETEADKQDPYAVAAAVSRAKLRGDPDLRELVRFASLAANSHNTQPWRFRVSERSIQIRPDFSRRTPAVDPDDHHLYASLGCAAANLELAAAAQGRAGEVRFDPAPGHGVLFDFAPTTARPSALCDAIPLRQATRAAYDGRAVSASDLALLQRAGQLPGVDVVLVTDRGLLGRVRDLVIAGNSAQMADAAFVAELKQWMRFNPRSALVNGDGLYSAASGNPTLPTWLGALMFDLVFRADTENDKYASHIDSSPGVAVFVGERADAASWIQVGRACQRFALQATALGLKHAFINQPVEVTGLRGELASLIGMSGRRPDLVLRFGYGPTLPMSPRRPVESVIEA